MTALCLSYRRADSPDTVKLIHERLKHRLRGWEIFYDHQSIPQGTPFPELLRAKLASATAVLVVIGPRWLEILKQRASAAGIDHVREEVRRALEAGCTVVPVTVGNARMPSEADLADFPDLLPILKRNGHNDCRFGTSTRMSRASSMSWIFAFLSCRKKTIPIC